jgi:hypothetical protein
MAQRYENFDLYPVWQAEGISVECDCPALGGFPALKTRSRPKPLSVSIPTNNTSFSNLQKVGKEIAEVLLPQRKIRSLFRSWWNAGIKIRLRLIYPHPDFDDHEEKDRIEQIKGISSHPWEYVYFTRDNNDQPDPQYLLGIREDISIVHCLRKPEAVNARSISVGRLPFSIRYISNLGGDDQNEKEIFSEFEREIGILEEMVEYKAIENPDDFDAVMGFVEDHVVHITSHGSLEALKIEPDDPFTKFEALKAFNHALNPRVKGTILLSCSSIVGDGGLAAWLHRQANIPVVIGMTGSILPDPAGKNFVRGFYYGLNRPSEGLESAVFWGRLSMYNQGVPRIGETLLESNWDPGFGLPRLFLNGPDSILIPEDLLFGSLETMVSSFDNIIKDPERLADCKPETNQNLQKLFDWITQKKNAWYLVTGPKGTGKSTLRACLLHKLTQELVAVSQSPKIIYHFCQIEDAKTSDPLDFIRYSLAPQLVKHYGEDYIKAVPQGRFPLRVGNEKEAMRAFVIEPLRSLKDSFKPQQKFKPPVIIIDGIDVVDPNYSILDLLVDNRGDLEDIARFVVTADTVEPDFVGTKDVKNAEKIMDNIYWLTNHHHDRQPDLMIEASGDQRILFSKTEERFAPALAEKPTIKGWKELDNLFDRATEETRQDYAASDGLGKKLIRLLDVVTVAYEPLPANSMAVIIGLEPNSDKMTQLQAAVQPFFKKYEHYQNNLILFHSSLKAHLLDRIDQQPQRSLANMHGLFVQAFRPRSGDWAKITNWETLTGTKWPKIFTDKTKGQTDISRYVRRYLSDHAYNSYFYTPSNDPSKRQKRAKDFLNLTCDRGYRTIRLAEVGLEEALRDVWKGLRVVYTEYLQNLATQDNSDQARRSLDRLLAANESDSDIHNELIELERRLRVDPLASVPALFKFLDLDPNLWDS